MISSDFIWDFGKLPFPTHLGKYFIRIGKIRAKIHEIGKIKAIFGLGRTPIYGLKNGQIKSPISMKVCCETRVLNVLPLYRIQSIEFKLLIQCYTDSQFELMQYVLSSPNFILMF